MDCYIKEIIIFNKSGEKRSVSLERGLNIITGDSKTGKSALIEIVDYCLCSKTSNIPRGKISEFAHLFAIVLAFKNKYLVIGRKRYSEGGNTKLLVKLETDENLFSKINLNYFENITPLNKKDAQEEIEHNLNLSVRNISYSDDVDDREKRKASLREMTSFLFQHQNLIANKHALFYRFDDNYKRKAVIDSFPVFSGWANDEYFSLNRQLENKKKQLRQVELSKKKKDLALMRVENEIKGYFKNYYSLIGEPFDETEFSFSDLLNLRRKLPNYSDKTFTSQQGLERYKLLEKQIQEKSAEFNLLGKQIKDLEETEKFANEFSIGLEILEKKSVNSNFDGEIYNCPICGKEHNELNLEMKLVSSAKESLEKELSQLNGYAVSFNKEIDSLNRKQSELNQEIKILKGHRKELGKVNTSILEEKIISEKVIYAKAQLDLRIDLLSKETSVRVDDEVDELKGEIERLEQQLTKFSLGNEFKKAETFLSRKMNKIGSKLDFEIELTPLQFWFDLREFDFTHNAPSIGEIHLREMGSGANWLTCHLSLFLSLLSHFAIQRNSVVPSFLFLDQPSQVYFPHEFGVIEDGEDKDNDIKQKDNDIKQVEKIYIAILEELDEIKKESGFLPQVIVTDHADGLDLGKYDFNSYVRRRWRPNSDGKLI